MDLSSTVYYNGCSAMPAALTGGGAPASGIVFQSVDLSEVSVDTNVAKSPNQDGLDVSDLNLGGRRISIAGTVYGTSVGDAFDNLTALLAAYSPRGALSADTDNVGFLPLYFHWPTADLNTWPDGYLEQLVYARPEVPVKYSLQQSDFNATRGLTIPFHISLLARDPRRYLQTEQVISVAAQGSAKYTGGTAIPYRGTAPTVPIISLTLSASATTVEVYSWPGPDRFGVTLDMTGLANGTYTIDLRDKLLRDANGDPVGAVTPTSAMMQLVEGTVAKTAPAVAVSVTYREAWL